MGRIYTQPRMLEARRELRSSMSPSERILWTELRHEKLCGCKFRRQHSIGSIVLDFYSAECRIAVEVDGGYHHHATVRQHDDARDATLESLGLTVLRFSNDDVRFRLKDVLSVIGAAIVNHRNANKRG
jgi:very-short-patch-repair endonuclease